MSHPLKAKKFVADENRMHWHNKTSWFLREKRDQAIKNISNWEKMRQMASDIKTHTMSKLAFYLEEFETNAIKKGIKVHWAKDAQEHNEIVYSILKKNNAKKIVKSKSMLTEECHLNPYLEKREIEVVDTDLGERIIQFNKETPSHIVAPAIHLKKEDIAQIFYKHIGTDKNNSNPQYLTRSIREHLRKKFLNSDASITGVNFAIAQTGGIVVCTNEGNADMGTSISKLHIACMGIEKIIPKFEDLAIFIDLLARSATGQSITTYTSHFHAPIENGGMHIVIVDNKRSNLLENEKYNQSLNCIRCGACLNTCPVYRRSGGHSYNYVIPGPVGSILGAFKNTKKHKTLPFACTLCVSCSMICPLKIDLDKQLYYLRQDIVKKKLLGNKKIIIIKITSYLMLHPKLLDFVSFWIRKIITKLPNWIIYNNINIWGQKREIPKIPKNSFKEIMKKQLKKINIK
jgi:L-lactate dehydrogenase complex protein LldF